MAPLELTRIAAGSSIVAAALVAAAWEGLVLAGVVAVCLRMLPGITAAARSVVWTVVMLAVVGLPFVHFGGTSGASGQVHLDERVGLGLVVVWALFSVVRAGQLVRSAVWLRGISRRAVPVGVGAEAKGKYGDSGFARMTAPPMTTLLHGRAAELCVSGEVDRPCVVGFCRPRILVPADLLAKLSDGELEQIVLHEVEHLRRGDDWTNLVQKLSLVVFPLNPALIWIERQLCVERELACDDRVLKTTGARKAYAACLANLAEHTLVRRGVSLALGAWERQSEVVRRVHRILAGSRNEMGRRQVGAAVAVLMVGVVTGADGLAHAPALVSFGPGVVASAGQANLSPQEAFPQGLKPRFVLASYGGAEAPPLQNNGELPHQNNGGPVHQRNSAPPLQNNGVPPLGNNVGPRAKLVKAVMPVRRVRTTMKGSIPMVDAVKLASNMGHPSGLPSDEPMVVMVRWTSMAPVIVRDSQFTYAAVPTRNGWLFVQL
jgi:BlaR1 peptidase M56